jgi:hypothetical protein
VSVGRYASKTFCKWCTGHGILHHNSVLDECLSCVAEFLSIDHKTVAFTP